jgi:hypothetical protein
MTYRLATVLVVGTLAGALLLSPGTAPGEPPADPGAIPGPVKWSLARLSQDPFRLIKATPDAQKAQVRFLLEFTRAPTVNELYEWEHNGGPVQFRFLDEDGVVFRSIKPQWDGELIYKPGARVRLILPLPDDKTLAQTRAVVAD